MGNLKDPHQPKSQEDTGDLEGPKRPRKYKRCERFQTPKGSEGFKDKCLKA